MLNIISSFGILFSSYNFTAQICLFSSITLLISSTFFFLSLNNELSNFQYPLPLSLSCNFNFNVIAEWSVGKLYWIPLRTEKYYHVPGKKKQERDCVLV